MNPEEIKLEIEKISSKIEKLQSKRSNLIIKLEETDLSFDEKFNIWLSNCDNLKVIPDLFELQQRCPNIYKYFRESGYDRYKTVDVLEYLSDSFYYFDATEEEKRNYSEKEIKEIREIAKELMENNVSSFIFDW